MMDAFRPDAGPVALSSLSHVTDRRVRRILTLAGYPPRMGLPRAGERVAVWGTGTTAERGERMSREDGGLLYLEDAFLRSLHPGRAGEPPIGLLIDGQGLYYDASRPSDLEKLLSEHPLDDTAALNRARAAMAELIRSEVSKYAGYPTNAALPAPGYVLVIDQTHGDAAVTLGNAGHDHFNEMLTAARLDHAGQRIIVKGHPETADGHRPGYFDPDQLAQDAPEVSYLADRISPWQLLQGATAVYTVSSQMGFEAILAGHRPRVFGQPFYAGWNLTEDVIPPQRRGRRLTRAQLFLGAVMLYPVWYDPARDQLGRFEDSLRALSAEARAWREDKDPSVAHGMRLWKRGHLSRFYGGSRLRFEDDARRALDKAEGGRLLCWAGAADDALREASQARGIPLTRVEDGFLRSRGLGADLTPPLSLVTDRSGIYYDATRPSDLEGMIAKAAALKDGELVRAEALIRRLIDDRLTKYNLSRAAPPPLPEDRQIVLVPGQVEDDASITFGAVGPIRTNMALLEAARAARPDAFIVYKPHPDVEAGLRPGGVEADSLADLVARNADPLPLIAAADEVWTMTSLLGFEALIRGKTVICAGRPFYAAWGLTVDQPTPLDPQIAPRRTARPSLPALVQAALIDYPRYRDPVTGRPCPVEVIVDRLAEGSIPAPPAGHRLLSKLQGLMASQSWLWR